MLPPVLGELGSTEDEIAGVDLVVHGEEGYVLADVK